MVTLTTAENALKQIYLGVIADQLNTSANPLLAKFEQTTSDVWGNEIRKLAPFGINGGISAGTEQGDLPISAGNNYAQFVLKLKNLYGTIEISDKAMRASENSNAAFVNLLEKEMEGLLKASKFNFGRMLYGDGTGKLASVTAAEGNAFTVDNTATLVEGMVVDVISHATNGAVVSARRIVSVDRDNKKVTLDGATISGVSAGDYLTVQGSLNNELTGLGAIFGNSETLYGIARANYSWMRPYKKTSATIDDITIQSVIDRQEEHTGTTADFIVCSAGVRRAYQEYLINSRSNVDVMNLAGGYKAISYNGIPVVADRFAPVGTMYLLNSADFHLHQLCDWRWLEGNDGKVMVQMPNKPVYKATLVKYADLICDRPAAQSAIVGITEK